jgi:AraC family transcriptional regulator of adaptative response / DNA-3-methyladenine glycosylase II
VLTRRLLLAKQLLTETTLPVIDVAFASGFSSIRRFNDAFSRRYGMPPSRLRKTAKGAAGATTSPESFTLQLTYRPPFDWSGMIAFLGARALKGVEWVHEDAYFRTAQLGSHQGWICVRHAPDKRGLLVELTHSLTPVLPTVLGRLRHVFDLSARPDVIAAKLMEDGVLADVVSRNPGLRVPGAFDGFELAVRAILGQQVTVKGATTLAGRFVDRFGEEFETPHAGLTRLSPTSERIAAAKIQELTSLGIVQTRARCIIALAEEIASGRLKLEAGAQPNETIAQLVALPGVGTWTAQYIAMRALRWPDAFPREDVALRKNLGGVTAARAEALSQAWRPWRSYATLHLWQGGVQSVDND